MNVNRMKHFRWTQKTAWVTIAYVVAVPAMFGYMGFVTDVSLPSSRKPHSRSGALIRNRANGTCGGREGETLSPSSELFDKSFGVLSRVCRDLDAAARLWLHLYIHAPNPARVRGSLTSVVFCLCFDFNYCSPTVIFIFRIRSPLYPRQGKPAR